MTQNLITTIIGAVLFAGASVAGQMQYISQDTATAVISVALVLVGVQTLVKKKKQDAEN